MSALLIITTAVGTATVRLASTTPKLDCEPPHAISGQDPEAVIAHPDNALYGHNRVLAEFAGLYPSVPVIRGHLQHGWSEAYGLSLPPRLVSWLPKLVYSDANVRACIERGVRPVVPIGDPFCYIAASRGVSRAELAPSTIVYPLHGWEHDDVIGSHDALISEVSERECNSVTVCLYWREFDQVHIRRRYESAGFRVITHGYRADPLFTIRQLDELSLHTRVVTNRAATALWRGALLGLEAEIYGPVFSILAEEEAEEYRGYQTHRWPELCGGGVDGTRARELAAEELGLSHMREPEELTELLGWTAPRWRRASTRTAASLEFQLRRASYNIRLRLPREEPLPRF